MTRDLPQFLRDLLAAPPSAGEGVHNWLFRVAKQLHAHYTVTEIETLLSERTRNCGRQVSRQEILDAIRNSIACAWQHPGQPRTIQPAASKWPAVNQEQREAVIRDGHRLADLWELSPIRIEDNDQHAEQIISRLFPGNPLLCCGKSQFDFDTKPRGDWHGQLAQLQYITPSPMSATEGLTKEGKPSRHTLSNTGARRFLICEFDTGTTDEHAALLIHLGGYAPLVCVVHSGGKSLHGWFYVHGQPDAKVEKFFRYAVSLGADQATWTPSQFVRMPDGTRDDGNRQTVFFVNFKLFEARR